MLQGILLPFSVCAPKYRRVMSQITIIGLEEGGGIAPRWGGAARLLLKVLDYTSIASADKYLQKSRFK